MRGARRGGARLAGRALDPPPGNRLPAVDLPAPTSPEPDLQERDRSWVPLAFPTVAFLQGHPSLRGLEVLGRVGQASLTTEVPQFPPRRAGCGANPDPLTAAGPAFRFPEFSRRKPGRQAIFSRSAIASGLTWSGRAFPRNNEDKTLGFTVTS